MGEASRAYKVASPGFDVGLQICSGLWGYRGVAGDVEKNQIKSNKVDEEAQQHHRVSAEAAALVQDPKKAASWSDGAKPDMIRAEAGLRLHPARSG